MQVQEEIIRHKSFMAEEEAKLEQLRIKQELAEAEAEADMYLNAEDEQKAPLHQDHHYISQLPREMKQQTLDRLLSPDRAKDKKGLGPNVTPDKKGLDPKATPFTPSRTVPPAC